MTQPIAEQGKPDQLPQGEAGREIQAAQQSTAHPGISEDAGTSGPTGSGTDNFGNPVQQNVNPVGPDRRDFTVPQGNVNLVNFRPTTPEEQFLFGPTNRPNEPVSTGMLQSGRVAPPGNLWDWLPYLMQAAQMPNAPVEVQALAVNMAHFLNRARS